MFNKVDNWETERVCVIVSQCTNNDCPEFACVEHMNLKKKPTNFQRVYVC